MSFFGFGKVEPPVFEQKFTIIKGTTEKINNENGEIITINEPRKIDISKQFNEKVLPKIVKYVDDKQQIDKTLDADSAISRTITSITIHDVPTSVRIDDFSTQYPTWTSFLEAIENQTVCTKSGPMTIKFDLTKIKQPAKVESSVGGSRRRKYRKQYRQHIPARSAMRRVKNKTRRYRKRKDAIDILGAYNINL